MVLISLTVGQQLYTERERDRERKGWGGNETQKNRQREGSRITEKQSFGKFDFLHLRHVTKDLLT